MVSHPLEECTVDCFCMIFACGHKLLCFLRGVKGVTDDNGRGLGKVVNVGYWSRTVVMDILLFFNLAAILENMYIFPFPLVTVVGTCLRGVETIYDTYLNEDM
jgi:hypothetical protein